MTKRSLRNITLTALAISFGAAAFTIYGPRTPATAVLARAPEAAAAQVVPVAEVTRAELTRSVKLTAEFKPFQDVDLMAKVAGYVKHIYVDVGDRVREGQLLAVLEVPEMADELAKASASINRSTAEVAHANDEIRRAESAHQMAHLSYSRLSAVMQSRPGLVAQQEIDDAHSRDLVAEAQVAAAKSNLAAAEQAVHMTRAEESKTKTLMSYTRVVAPFSGVVTKRFANTGSMIQAGTASQTQAMPVVRLAQNTMLRLILPVPESMVPKIRLGQSVEVSVPSLARAFPGRVARFADEVDRSTRTMQTEVDIANPSYLLVPGMYAEVSLALDQRHNVLSIPLGAVDPGEQISRVFVVTGTGIVEIRDVVLGIETADRAEVRSGLKKGELVITGKRAGLKPGQHVTPKLTHDAKTV